VGRLDDKVAIISGGARGQGAAEGRLFASEGARVVLTDILDDEGKQTASDIGDAATYLHHDVTDEQAWTEVVAATLDEHGQIDVLVNNAGIFKILPMAMTDLAVWDQVIAINQTGVFLGMKSVTAAMVGAGRGSIINISSVAGLQGSPGTIAYSASKWAVRGMTKVAAKELGPFGVRVNSIHPGIIQTPMLEEFAIFGDDITQRLLDNIPLGTLAEADDVARLALYLASDESAYSTGAEFVVDGGMTA
jgi:3alpha(or 20beta)-hydroxysteroid dehydrogenase